MKLLLRFAVVIALCAIVHVRPAAAQFLQPSPDQADLTVDAAEKAMVLDSLCAAVRDRYVFLETAKQVEKALRARQKQGEYAGITSAKAFADSLTSHLRAVAHDLHLRVHYSHDPLPKRGPDAEPSAEEIARATLQQKRINYGFERVQRLAGNVGYLELRQFDGSPEAGELALAALKLLANSDALIVDLRRNGGGDPNLIALMLSTLFPARERVHVNDFYQRASNSTEQFWTMTTVPGPRYIGKEVYVLTSRRTGSAAEEFAYDIKNLRRGTLVGETTAGGANPGGLVRLDDHFAAFVAGGRAINPITKTNWEGVGVEPDIRVKAEDALKTAHVAAVEKLLAQATDADRRAALGRALDQAKNAPVEPLELGGPRRVAGN